MGYLSGWLQTFVFVTEEEPLYGKELRASSERELPRPDGPLVNYKVRGPYAELLLLKGRARARLSAYAPAIGERDCREALLLARQSFLFNTERGVWVLSDPDPLVAEFGCSNAFALDRGGNLHLPARYVPYFCGITVQIVEALFRAYGKGEVCYDLRRSHLRYGGGSAGTAGGIVPLVEIDGGPCARSEQFDALAALYRRLCLGMLDNRRLQDAWLPVL